MDFLSPTFSQLVSNERAISSILVFRLGDHQGCERGDKVILQRQVQSLGFYISSLLFSTESTGRETEDKMDMTLIIYYDV